MSKACVVAANRHSHSVTTQVRPGTWLMHVIVMSKACVVPASLLLLLTLVCALRIRADLLASSALCHAPISDYRRIICRRYNSSRVVAAVSCNCKVLICSFKICVEICSENFYFSSCKNCRPFKSTLHPQNRISLLQLQKATCVGPNSAFAL